MFCDIIKKSIDNITLDELDMLYNARIATVKIANNQLAFILE